MLLFDEADALLTRRGDGNASRHDDAAVNVLLQRIERHDACPSRGPLRGFQHGVQDQPA